MKKWQRTTILFITLSCMLFTACGGTEKKEADAKKEIKVYNWGDYIDETVLKTFTEKTGIKVVYDTFATNEDMYVKLNSGGADYDVAFPSDYIIKKMINENLLQKLDYANIPNAKFIDPKHKGLAFDPKDQYSIPYMWGTLGILYNKKMVTEKVDSWNILWDEKYKKKIFMMDSLRDSIGVALKKSGYSLNTKKSSELEQAQKDLMLQKPLVLAYGGDEIKKNMANNEGALCIAYSGDAITAIEENPDLDYVIPKEGSNAWVDSMVIPKGAKNKKEAEMFINFMCETEIAKKNTKYIGFSTPQTEAYKELEDDVKNNEIAYPSDETLERCEVFEDLSDVVRDYDKAWTEIKAHQGN